MLVSSTPLDVLLPRLRELGAAPVVEAADGTVHVARPDLLPGPHAARSPRRPRLRRAHETAHVAQVVNAVRSGDRAAASPPGHAGATLTPSGSLAALREAVEAGATVLIGYVDNHGARSRAHRRPASGSRAAGSPRTTTAATTSAPSRSTGSRRSSRWTPRP